MFENAGKVLDYEPPYRHGRRDALDYYREPPAAMNWTIWGVFAWLISFIVLLIACARLFAIWFKHG